MRGEEEMCEGEEETRVRRRDKWDCTREDRRRASRPFACITCKAHKANRQQGHKTEKGFSGRTL